MKRNIVISGWPGTGSTTLALLLTKNLGYTLLRGTETFREISRRLDKSDTGSDRVEVDSYLEPIFGPVYDKYIDYKLLNTEGLVIETDIGAFRLGKRSEFFSIFLHATRESRIQRLAKDGRSLDINVIKEREENLANHYKDLHGLEWFDLQEINDKYNLPLDNSSIDISEELELIYPKLVEAGILDTSISEKLIKESENDEKKFWTEGKDHFIDVLAQNNKIIQGTAALEEIKKLFPEEVAAFPEKLKNLI